MPAPLCLYVYPPTLPDRRARDRRAALLGLRRRCNGLVGNFTFAFGLFGTMLPDAVRRRNSRVLDRATKLGNAEVEVAMDSRSLAIPRGAGATQRILHHQREAMRAGSFEDRADGGRALEPSHFRDPLLATCTGPPIPRASDHEFAIRLVPDANSAILLDVAARRRGQQDRPAAKLEVLSRWCVGPADRQIGRAHV